MEYILTKHEANLPKLPEGYYWNINNGPTGREYPYVCIVEKRRWWWDRQIVGRWTSDNHHATLADKVEFIAGEVHREFVHQRQIARESANLKLKENN